MKHEATHAEPAWRDKSNFIIAVEIDPVGTGTITEQLWACQIDETHYELCCIPFFAYDLALGDVVEVDGDYLVRRVSKASGRYVFRVSFDGTDSLRNELVVMVESRGGLVEHSSAEMFAVDAPNLVTAQAVADALQVAEDERRCEYETGKTG